jgi:type II secretory pathway predicted ATPase ExeA
MNSESQNNLPKPSRIMHPEFEKAYIELERKVLHSDYTLVFVVGSPGTGKTTLRKLLQEKLELEFSLLPEEERKGKLAVVSEELSAPLRGSFNFQPVMYQLLKLLKQGDAEHIDRPLRWGGQEMLEMLKTILEERRPRACLLDEGQHLAIGHPDRLLMNLAALKTLANTTHTKFVIFGTYELMEAARSDASLCRRVGFVNLSRYDRDDHDRVTFSHIIRQVFDLLGIESAFDPRKHDEYLYDGCLGSIGVLHDWVVEAAAIAQLKRRALALADLEATIRHIAERTSMISNIGHGEILLRERPEDHENFKQMLLDLGSMVPAQPPVEKPKRKRRSRIGLPNPRRLPIGGMYRKRAAGET